jgi:hypothetical protein
MPIAAYTCQWQIGSPSAGVQPLSPSTIFPMKMAIMPPAKNPVTTVKQPTITIRTAGFSGGGSS